MLLIILIVSRAKVRDIFFAENVLITAVDRMHTLPYICLSKEMVSSYLTAQVYPGMMAPANSIIDRSKRSCKLFVG
jgi:hypothetical protein